MSWETVTNWISRFFDKPVVISITTILSLGGLFFAIFSCTSFGRKTINKLTNLYHLAVEKVTNTEKKVQEVERLANEKVESLKADYEKKTIALVSIVDYYVESLFALAEKIPNAKVQDQLVVLKEGYEEKKLEISQIVSFTYQDFNEKLELIQKEVQEEKDAQIGALKGEIARLEELIQTYINPKEEGENGQETEETKDTNPTQEEV